MGKATGIIYRDDELLVAVVRKVASVIDKDLLERDGRTVTMSGACTVMKIFLSTIRRDHVVYFNGSSEVSIFAMEEEPPIGEGEITDDLYEALIPMAPPIVERIIKYANGMNARNLKPCQIYL